LSEPAAPRTLPSSLWAATAPPGPPAPPLKGPAEADVAVVGAGYTGLSAALHLAERGASVVVLDAGEPGWGASGRNGGQVIPGLKYDPDEIEAKLGPERGAALVAFAGRAPDLVFDLVRRYAIPCDPVREGWLQPAHSPAGRVKAERRAEQWQKRGADAEALDRAAMAQLLGSEAYCGGWIDRRGGTVQPLALARGLAAVAVAKGIAVHGQSPARTLTRGGGKWYLEVPGGSVTAETVLLCTNGYTGALFPGLEREVVAVNSYQAATRPLPEAVRGSILPGGQAASDTRRILLYWRLDRDGRFIVGGRGTGDDDPGTERFERLRRAARDIYPQLRDAEWSNHWSGRVALTRDFLPHLLELGPGLFAGLGYQGRGVAMATAMGQLLAARAQGAAESSLPLPMGPRQPFPMHGLRVPVVYLLSRWYRLLDGLA
jgi:glycine/D-amino acid oxidase-like deaminating enzyme